MKLSSFLAHTVDSASAANYRVSLDWSHASITRSWWKTTTWQPNKNQCECASYQKWTSVLHRADTHAANFCRQFLLAQRFASAVYAVTLSVCLSVRPSQVGVLPKRLNIGSREQRRTIAEGLLFSDAKYLNDGAKCRWRRVKIAFFDRSRSLSSDALPPPRICIHPPWWSRRQVCAGGGIRGVINNVGRSRSLLITRPLGVTYVWRGASCARFAIVEPIATMRVDNYAGSRIKSHW